MFHWNKKNTIALIHIIYAAFILTSLLIIPCCSMLPQPVIVEDNFKAIIVTVDGLSFANTLVLGTSVIEKSNEYLQANLSKLINSGFIRSYTWSGNAGDTAGILASSDTGLRKFFLINYQEAKDTNKAFIVVSHSWGTFLSYLALSLEPAIDCDLFITLSSPLGTSSGLPVSPEKIVRDYTDAKLAELSFNILLSGYPNAKLFYNFWANGDLISGSLSGKIPPEENVHDIRVDDGISDNRYIPDCFFWHKFTTLGDEIVTPADPSYSAYLIYLTAIGIFDVSPVRNDFINQTVALIQSASGY